MLFLLIEHLLARKPTCQLNIDSSPANTFEFINNLRLQTMAKQTRRENEPDLRPVTVDREHFMN